MGILSAGERVTIGEAPANIKYAGPARAVKATLNK
jgi:hypothetical protein